MTGLSILKMAFDGEKLIGFHALKLIDEESVRFAHIGTFWVHGEHQKQGIGKGVKMMGEEWAREKKCDFIQTGVNFTNERMLEINNKAGYEVFSQILRKKL